MDNYYETQLKKLKGHVKVKFTSCDGETNWMNLTEQTCVAISKTITKLRNDNVINVPQGG